MEMCFQALKINFCNGCYENSIPPIKALECNPMILVQQNSKNAIETVCFAQLFLFILRI